MALTPSTMLNLGSPAPVFSLTDTVTGKNYSLSDFEGKKGLLVIFMCRHCPYVQHVKEELAKIGKDYRDKDLAIAAISSNDAERYPDDTPDSLKEMAEQEGFVFPLLFDENQEVAKKYKAACTPDFFLFDKDRMLVYRGQLDGSRPGNNVPVTGKDLREAIDYLLEGKAIDPDQKPSIGCNIKWKEGNHPEYFQG